MAKINRITAAVMLTLIKAYQWGIRPYLGHHCRFNPNCSSYAIEAIESHGVIKGSYLMCRRLLRCHPWCSGGMDPVPKRSP